MTRLALLLLLLPATANAAGWLLGSYTVPDSLPAQVHGILCKDGTCVAKAVWDSAGGYSVPITEGSKGSRQPFRSGRG